jgi:hypothetical protein
MNDSQEIQWLIDSAHQYVDMAMGKLADSFRGPDEPDFDYAFDLQMTRLFVHFLFPNLDDHERAMLVAMRQVREEITLKVNTDQSDYAEPVKREHEHTLTQFEEAYMKLKDVILESGLISKLTEIQEMVLEEEFFHFDFALSA